jgi:crossover junction endodeoxyribonuclease RuvC
MLILGIDPGTATTGYGFLTVKGKSTTVENWGLIETDKNGFKENRLEKIYKETSDLLKLYKPDVFVMEKIFFATNAKTAIAVGQAQGVLLLAASKGKVRVEEYAPGTIKKMITGDGRAKKNEIQKAVRRILGNHIKSEAHKKTHFDNAADALAVALTHAMKLNGSEGGEKNV